jgi:Zn-dependent M28 family amino/carboxypeptidase
MGTRSDASGNCGATFPTGGAICNGATDNAAGVAVVLAAGRAIRKLGTRPRRSVVLALWDAEEDGLLGSFYYVNNPLVPLSRRRTAAVAQGAPLSPV